MADFSSLSQLVIGCSVLCDYIPRKTILYQLGLASISWNLTAKTVIACSFVQVYLANSLYHVTDNYAALCCKILLSFDFDLCVTRPFIYAKFVCGSSSRLDSWYAP